MPSDASVLSFLAVRRALGILGLALPVVLYVYAVTLGYGMQPSISEFYHTDMGDYLVGSLIAIGVFLVSYRGYPKLPNERLSDRWVSTLAGIGAIGVALFPAQAPDPEACPPSAAFTIPGDIARDIICPVQGFVFHWTSFDWIHFASAALFFGCLAVFCLFLFPKGDRHPDGSINWSFGVNWIYLICGLAILTAIAFLIIYAVAGEGTKAALAAYNYVFWWESVGVIAFGISWLTKGKTLQAMRALIQPQA